MGLFNGFLFTKPLTTYETTQDTSLYGIYGIIFTVTFDPNGGNTQSFASKKVLYESEYGDLPAPMMEGYTFDGWFTEEAGGEKIEAGSIATVFDDHTLYAHWSIGNYTLTFIFGNGAEPFVRVLEFNETIPYPAESTREWYSFNGWDNNPTFMPGNDTIITALWTPNKYTLTFIFGNGAEPLVRVLEFNETITYPAEPVRTGYSFNGWDSNPTFMPGNDTILKALWSPNTYMVTFNSDGGNISELATKSVTFDSPYGKLPTPSRTGYTFLGWFTDKNESITEESIVITPDNHTLYAHWTEIPTPKPFSSSESSSSEVPTKLVEIVFSSKDMTQEEIEKFIRKYTDADVDIITTERNAGETRIIVNCFDAEVAQDIIRKVDDALMMGREDMVRCVRFAPDGTGSFSAALHLVSIFYLV